MAMYKALHVIEAARASRGDRRASNHSERLSLLRTENAFQQIYKHYKPLYDASTIARYLSDHAGPGFKSFTDYMKPQEVLSELIRHRLHQVEQSAVRMLKSQQAALASQLLLCANLPSKLGTAAVSTGVVGTSGAATGASAPSSPADPS